MPLVLLMLVALVSSLSGQGTESDPMLKNTGGRPIVAHATTSPYRELARGILRELVEIRSTQFGVGPTAASEAVARRLLAPGYPATGIHVAGPSPRKQNLVARLRGRTKDKPTLLFAHLDVGEARKGDRSCQHRRERLSRLHRHDRVHVPAAQDGPCFIAYCAEVPGADGQGKSREECLANLREEIAPILNDRREESLHSLPPETVQELITTG